MTCSIVSPEKSVTLEDVKYVSVPGTLGKFGIMPHHTHLISSLEAGRVRITLSDNQLDHYLLPQGGFVEVKNEMITIVAQKIMQVTE